MVEEGAAGMRENEIPLKRKFEIGLAMLCSSINTLIKNGDKV